jgi:hypothetical protein
MKIFCIAFFALLIVADLVRAQEKSRLSLSTSYQQDDFQWSIAGTAQGTSPNILSELTWNNLRGPVLSADLDARIWKKLYIKGAYRQLFIHAGKVNDTDYLEDNRTIAVFVANLDSSKGHSSACSAALAYSLDVGSFSLKPYVGYSHNTQLLYLLDQQSIHSTYKAQWKGLMSGISLSTALYKKLHLETDWRYHQVSYSAVADWNIVKNFRHPISFRHTAKGFGAEGMLNLVYAIKEQLRPYLSVHYAYWATGTGIDELYYATGANAITRLNKVERQSAGMGVGVHLYF